ncbi:hypothetical protein M9458_043692, partial [Cirrhinus mrigala]
MFSCSGFVTLDQLSVTCSEENICAVKGTEVTLKCSYSNINIKTVFWFSEKQKLKQLFNTHNIRQYQLMFIMNDGVKHLSSAVVNLTVT